MSWTYDRAVSLIDLWAEGHSPGQIATKLGGVTKNAVIGKAHRLGLSGKKTITPEVRAAAMHHLIHGRSLQYASSRPSKKALALQFRNFEDDGFTPVAEKIKVPLSERKSCTELRKDDCRWPIGDPQLSGFHFCNRDQVPGKPYCEYHCRRAYEQSQPQQLPTNEGQIQLAAA